MTSDELYVTGYALAAIGILGLIFGAPANDLVALLPCGVMVWGVAMLTDATDDIPDVNEPGSYCRRVDPWR